MKTYVWTLAIGLRRGPKMLSTWVQSLLLINEWIGVDDFKECTTVSSLQNSYDSKKSFTTELLEWYWVYPFLKLDLHKHF